MKNSHLKERKNRPNKQETSKSNNGSSQKQNKSLLGSCCKILIFLFPIILLPVIPYLTYDPTVQAYYIKLPQSPKFEGNLKENKLLQNAVHFAKGKLAGPETILFVNGTMYSGLTNGQLVRIDKDGEVHKIAQIGDTNEENCDCVILETISQRSVIYAFASILALLNQYPKSECGRPSGLRYNSGFIYLADVYHGIFKIDLKTNQKYPVIRTKDKELNFVNDLDIDDEGNIYFSACSRKREAQDSIKLHVEAIPDGRVFQYNEKTKKLTVLMDNLVFPNGVQLSPNKDAVFVAEHCMARLLKYYLKGPKQGQIETVASLPGFPDNIRLSNRNTLLVAFALTRNPNPYKPTILDLLGEYPFIRTIIGRFLNMEKISLLLSNHALGVEYDLNGNILRSWHDPTGEKIETMSCITEHENKLYLGSFIHDYIGVVDY